jgi:hypothetical protein
LRAESEEVGTADYVDAGNTTGESFELMKERKIPAIFGWGQTDKTYNTA